MTFDSALNILSFMLAIYALFQAKSASQTAQEAKLAVRKNRQTSDLGRLNGALDLAIQEIKIYGPVSSTDKLRGIDRHSVAEKIQDFILILRDHLGQLEETEQRKATRLCENIIQLLNDFGNEKTSVEDARKHGQSILYKLSKFSSELKTSLNRKIEIE